MMKMKLEDGEWLEADDAEGLIRKLASGGLIDYPDIGEYMIGVAARCEIWNRTVVRTDTYEHFLDDIMMAGMITELVEIA